jgi:Family of unknown function (DUF6526)
MPPSQSYANHRRWFPLFHFVLQPVLFVNLLLAVRAYLREPGMMQGWAVVMALALIVLAACARLMALKVQNRVIRLEQWVRLSAVLPPELRARIPELRLRHLIGLRFASDAELPALVLRCLAGELTTADQVKREVRNWQPDHLRA